MSENTIVFLLAAATSLFIMACDKDSKPANDKFDIFPDVENENDFDFEDILDSEQADEAMPESDGGKEGDIAPEEDFVTDNDVWSDSLVNDEGYDTDDILSDSEQTDDQLETEQIIEDTDLIFLDENVDMEIPDNDLLPFCGDGFTDANEQCDEGLNNGVAGSYCSDQCVNLGEQQHPAIADTGRTDDFEITTPIAEETVVTDLVTNLMWQQMTSNSSSLWQGAFDYCENLTYAGFNDWHLPTLHEISSLVDYGISHSALYEPISSSMGWDNGNLLSALVYLPTINDDYNLNTWFVQLYNSRVFPSWGGGLDDTAICVRRLAETYPLAVRYEEQTGSDSKIVVKDNKTSLHWIKEELGPTDFHTAQTICADLNYGDYDDWEAPSVVDLLSLIDYSHYDPASTFPGISSNVFWTNLTDSYHTNYQWYVDMMSGTLDYQPTENYFVRCVRR